MLISNWYLRATAHNIQHINAEEDADGGESLSQL